MSVGYDGPVRVTCRVWELDPNSDKQSVSERNLPEGLSDAERESPRHTDRTAWVESEYPIMCKNVDAFKTFMAVRAGTVRMRDRHCVGLSSKFTMPEGDLQIRTKSEGVYERIETYVATRAVVETNLKPPERLHVTWDDVYQWDHQFGYMPSDYELDGMLYHAHHPDGQLSGVTFVLPSSGRMLRDFERQLGATPDRDAANRVMNRESLTLFVCDYDGFSMGDKIKPLACAVLKPVGSRSDSGYNWQLTQLYGYKNADIAPEYGYAVFDWAKDNRIDCSECDGFLRCVEKDAGLRRRLERASTIDLDLGLPDFDDLDLDGPEDDGPGSPFDT
jgi:hypothetical protein